MMALIDDAETRPRLAVVISSCGMRLLGVTSIVAIVLSHSGCLLLSQGAFTTESSSIDADVSIDVDADDPDVESTTFTEDALRCVGSDIEICSDGLWNYREPWRSSASIFTRNGITKGWATSSRFRGAFTPPTAAT